MNQEICNIPQIPREDIDLIIIKEKFNNYLYKASYKDSDVILYFTLTNPCEYLKYYPYFPQIIGMYVISVELGQYAIILRDENFSLPTAGWTDYRKVLSTLVEAYKSNITNISINEDKILVNAERAFFLDFRGQLGLWVSLMILDEKFNSSKFDVWGEYEQIHGQDVDINLVIPIFDQLTLFPREVYDLGYHLEGKLPQDDRIYNLKDIETNENCILVRFEYGVDGERDNLIYIGDKSENQLYELFFSQVLKFPYIGETLRFAHGKGWMGYVMNLPQGNLKDYQISENNKVKFIYQLGSTLKYLDRLGYGYENLTSDDIRIRGGNIELFNFDKIRVGKSGVIDYIRICFDILFDWKLPNDHLENPRVDINTLIDNNEKLEIVNLLHTLFQRRITYENFLNSKIFDDVRIPELYNFTRSYNTKPELKLPPFIKTSDFQNAVDMIFEMIEGSEAQFRAVDYFYQKIPDYISLGMVSNRKSLIAFALSIIFIFSSINLKPYTLNALTKEDPMKLYEFIIYIIKREECQFDCDTLANYIPENRREKGKWVMKNINLYSNGDIKRIASKILLNETF